MGRPTRSRVPNTVHRPTVEFLLRQVVAGSLLRRPVILHDGLVLLIAKVKRYKLVVLAGSFDSLKELAAKLNESGVTNPALSS
jgi:hypothetical protein